MPNVGVQPLFFKRHAAECSSSPNSKKIDLNWLKMKENDEGFLSRVNVQVADPTSPC